MGPYARTARRDTFVEKQNDGIPNDLAALRGGRICVCDEFPKNRRPNEELLKQISGGDPITARFLQKEDFTYQPTYKVAIITNNRLKFDHTSYAIELAPVSTGQSA